MLVFLVALWSAAPAAACRLALLLAVDVSRSVDANDYAIQRGGIVAALRDPEVRAAFLGGDAVAVAVYEWSGRSWQKMVVDWRLIDGPVDLDALAFAVEARQPPKESLPTAMGRAVEYGLEVFANAPRCDVQVLDVSGDGRNNEGYSPTEMYGKRDFGTLIVNGLAIGQHETDVADYYRRELIRGPGAFVEEARHQSDFPAAIKRKLIREVTAVTLGWAAPEGARPALR